MRAYYLSTDFDITLPNINQNTQYNLLVSDSVRPYF